MRCRPGVEFIDTVGEDPRDEVLRPEVVHRLLGEMRLTIPVGECVKPGAKPGRVTGASDVRLERRAAVVGARPGVAGPTFTSKFVDVLYRYLEGLERNFRGRVEPGGATARWPSGPLG